MSRRRRDTTALAVGSAVSGLLAYAVFALTTRALGPERAAPVSVLWSYWSFAGAALTFPLQHWIASTVVSQGEGAVRAAMARLWAAVVASVALGALAWAVREPLFHRDDLWFPALVALVTFGSALVGVARGGLTARGRFREVGLSFAGENAIRCAAVVGLIVAGVRSPVAYGLALVAGHLIAFAWPSALHFARGPATTSSSPLAFLGAAGASQLLAQTVLTGGPVLLALAGGTPAEVTALFAALALFRAPYVLALGLVSQLTGLVTRLVKAGEVDRLRRINLLVAGGTVSACVIAGLVAFVVGPELLALVFGSRLEYSSIEAALVGVGCVLAVGNLVCTVILLARNRPSVIVRSWVVSVLLAAAAFAALGLAGPASPTDRTVAAFLVAEGVAFALLLREQWLGPSGSRRVGMGHTQVPCEG
jgi:O-antigen/teichoic acid export membrane protein